MAKQTGFNILHGFSGKLGGLVVLRRRGNKTIIAACPGRRRSPPSQGQIDHQYKFRLAIAYAQNAMKDPKRKARYEKLATGRKSAFNVAVAEYLRKSNEDEKKHHFTIAGLFKRM
jgi:hypothetical protein